MIKVYDTIECEVEYFDTWILAEEFVKSKCIEYNKGFDPDEFISEIDFEIEEYFKCGYCGYDLEENIRYCSKSCHEADNTEGV